MLDNRDVESVEGSAMRSDPLGRGNRAVKKAGRSVDLLSFRFLLVFVLLMASKGHCEGIMDKVLQNMKQTELEEIQWNKLSTDYFGYKKGSIPVLISAPHGAKHFRTEENRWKAEDAYTSSLAIELGRLTGAHVIYLKNKAGEDPNNDMGTRYKQFLAKIVREKGIKFVMDLHGASGSEPFKIDVGTIGNSAAACSCPTFKPVIQKEFQDFDKTLFNKKFRAKGCGTITYFVRHDLGIEAAQFEINARYRVVESRSDPLIKADPNDVLDLIERLRSIIFHINAQIQQNV